MLFGGDDVLGGGRGRDVLAADPVTIVGTGAPNDIVSLGFTSQDTIRGRGG